MYKSLNNCIYNFTFVFKENNVFKEDIRKYLENDEAIDSVDYLIELKNNMCNNNSNLLNFIQTVIINIIMYTTAILRTLLGGDQNLSDLAHSHH